MADIFISYAHSDRDRIRPIVKMLEDEGWTIWWDRGIEPGMKWLPTLEKELANCRTVVVIWSKISSDSKWVHKEADAGLAKGALVPIVIDKSIIPEKYSEYHATNLSSWKGDTSFHVVQSLLRRLAGLVPPSRIDTVRPGYDTKFLGDELEIPLPGVTGSAAMMRYNHFTVVMNTARRLAHYTAYNTDGKKFIDLERPNKWAADPLLPDSLQIELSLLRQSPYDRGHLMAQMTVRWGEKRSASISTRQAFYWTNVAPQSSKFNRLWWLKLEKWERHVAKNHGRISGFSGPVFSDDDEPFRGEMELDDGLIVYGTFRVPRAYWKLVVVPAPGGGVQLAAHLMDQFKMEKDNVGGNFDLSDYRVSLKELEQQAQLRFGSILHKAAELAY